TKTSDQIAPFRAVLEATPYSVPVSYWDVQGTWSDDQTSNRWHITSTSLQESSYPGLAAITPQTPAAAGRPFRHALSFHGFSSSQNDVILGGDAPLNTKCLIVTRIKDRLAAVTPTALDRNTIAFVLHDAEGVFDIAGLNNRTVARRDLSGLSDDNIVNRLSSEGGIQLEQSKAVRDSQTLRDAVAKGAATALGEVFNNTAPADACDVYGIDTN
ncbi:MAG TPA: poly-gamma-glutamate hydrolase family protein, partial [Thermoanaerobaculia bacterium]|nr:poly-gamma-glutamate hydrolase family protein [Thermoanaerobaculia bacterium]